MIATHSLPIRDHEFLLTNQRAVFWKEREMLILSDVHLGKTAHFRHSGIPLPQEVAEADLHRLGLLIHQFSPKHLLIVGDFFHAGANSELELFSKWRTSFSKIDLILIKGNHDRLQQDVYDKLGMETRADSLTIDDIEFVHQPHHGTSKNGKNFSICGHIHPGVLIKGHARQKLKLPCYLMNKNQLILPAFSRFTGLDTRFGRKKDYRYYAITDTDVIYLNGLSPDLQR